MVNLLWFFN